MNICLISTLHDPDNKLRDATMRLFPTIRNLFSDNQIKITPQTEYNDYFENGIVTNSDAALGRLTVLKTALNKTDSDAFFYLDFDRLLYWQSVLPGELKQTICSLTNKLTVIGRTKAAFETHPELQRVTERAANIVFSRWYGEDIDILTGCRLFPRGVAEKIARQSDPRNIAHVDAEWLMIANEPIRYFEVNGLAYEHALFNLEKSPDLEIKTRIENLYQIARCICSGN